MKFTTPRTIAAILVAGLALATAGPAIAASATATGSVARVPSVKSACLADISHDLDALANGLVVLDAAPDTTSDHLATLQGIISSAESELRSAESRLSATDNPTLIRDICSTVGTDLMVDEVVVPQISITVAADRISATEIRVIDPTLGYVRSVAKAEAMGADMSEAVRLHDLAMDEFMTAFDTIAGVSDSVLSVTAAGYTAGPGADTIVATRESLADSLDHMHTAWGYYEAANQAFADALAAI